MYQYHHHHSGGTGHGEVSGDPLLSSRPDALLASGGAFLSSPPPVSYMPPYPLVHPPSQLQTIVPLSPTLPGVAAATPGDLIREDEEPRPGRYSAEERQERIDKYRQERIDKYRSKRNQRNFHKKITYACRKTLADSRPRVKGRFARNGGYCTEAEADHHVLSEAVEPNKSLGDASKVDVPEWWPAMPQLQHESSLPAGTDLDDLCTDDEMLAAYLGVSSISLHSPSTSGH